MKTLIAGVDDFLLPYMCREFSDAELFTAENAAGFADTRYDLVILGADAGADGKTLTDATRNRLHRLSALTARPLALCFISTADVYSPDAGESVSENSAPAPASALAADILDAERECRLWGDAASVPVTVLRPALMFGQGVTGLAADMFLDVINGRYLHVRGIEGRLSLVTAVDVARAVRLTMGTPGTFNVADGIPATWLQLAEAMSANAGARKRMITLPRPWADLAWRWLRFIPAITSSCSPAAIEARSVSRTLDCAALQAAGDWHPYPTLEVIARTCADYPYLIED